VNREIRSHALEAVRTLGRLATVFAERRKQLAESVGLTDQQWQALEEVQAEHFMPTLFAQKRETSAAAVSKILRQLVDKGLVVARVSEHDGRQRAYDVTPKALELLGLLRDEREAVIRAVWMSYPSEELAQFAVFGSDLAERLETLVEERKRELERAKP
jgi:DNA-binding MarR family transcriptional regulator